LILIAALVIGAISAFLVFNYVNSADDRARGKARTVQVLKIEGEITKGTFGREASAQNKIVTAEISAEFKPVTAIVDPSIIQDKVAVANFATGQILVEGMFADPIENQITFAGRVPDDCAPTSVATGKATPCVGITISVDQTKGVAGVIVPGDLVNILVVPDAYYCKAADENVNKHEAEANKIVSNPDSTSQPGVPNDAGATICNPARYLYQAAKVLFVDRTAVPQPGELTPTGANAATPAGTAQTSVNTGLITLEVPAAAAQLIASVSPDSIYLTLLPPNYTDSLEPLPKLDPYPAVLPGEDPTKLTPYGPQGIQGDNQ
jgi:hypothetical protein